MEETQSKNKYRALFLKPWEKGNKNIVRDFVYGCWCNGKRIGGMQMPPINEIYCATHARSEVVDAVFIDAQTSWDRFEEIESSGYASIDCLILMCSTQSFRSDLRILEKAKSLKPAIKTVLFGSHPTFMPEYALAGAVDFLVRKEPEETIRVLLDALARNEDTSRINGTGYRDKDGKVVLNANREFCDMDVLPIPDRTLLPENADYFNPVVHRLPYTTIQTSRGCPGRCIFCTSPEFYGKKYRARSAENVLKELREIKKLGYREVFFRDETFTALKKRNAEICQAMINEKLNLSWIANGRVDMIDKEMMALMKKAGCHMLKFGVETSSDELLKTYRKGTTSEQARACFKAARELGIETHAHLVFGGPGESWNTINTTIKFVKEIKPSTASFGILTPYPGTELFAMVASMNPSIQDGSDSNMDNLHTEGFYSKEVSGMTGDELSLAVKRAYRKFYLRPSYVLGKLLRIRSFEQLVILVISGLNILSFSISGKK
ncbi:MAG: B12-binding domain-containing radical SAM protein [Lentisphaerae bacterium GWF2_44_16]|nr:MAG: B12-binding domain-containing radical SAM protein [Lentisphaerae bacterium GWF2_44_16]